MLSPPELLAQPARVVMRIDMARVGREARFVSGERLLAPALIVERDPDVEEGLGVVRSRREREAVVVLGRLEVARLVQEPPQVQVGPVVPGIERQGAPVGLAGLLGGAVLEVACPLVEAVGIARVSSRPPTPP